MTRLPTRYHTILVCLILSVSIFAVYGKVHDFEFLIYDDDVYVYENPTVKGGLRTSGIIWAFSEIHGANWHPLTWISHMLDVELFGLNPGFHHLVNVGFHILNSSILFIIGRFNFKVHQINV